MKKIAVTGGKGGTGKSTFAILLTNKFLKKGKKIILVDCDIECPNDFLILGEKKGPSLKKVYARFPRLNKDKCKKCGFCLQYCQEKAIFQVPNQYPVFLKELCSGCGACALVCPNKAIDYKKEKIGDIYLNKINQNFTLITGQSKPVLEETSPVVQATKKFALKTAQKIKADIIIFDTAAGTHCPVIAALMGSEKAYLITEPTPMGGHDLKLILDLLKKLKIPPMIVLNQSDLGKKDKIKKISQEYNSQIEIEIPYSKEIVKAYSQGKMRKINIL